MKKSVILLLGLCLSACAATSDERHFNPDWPPRAADGSRLGSVEDGPRPPLKQKWIFQTEGRIITSPAVKGGQVYLGSRDGRVYAVELASGAKLWEAEIEQGGLYGPPAATETGLFAGKAEAYYFVYGWERLSGKELWSRQSGELLNRAPWVLADADRVYTHFDPPPADGGAVGVRITALNSATGETLWQTPAGGVPEVSPALGGELLLVACNDNQLYAFDRISGALRWQAPLDSKPASAPLVHQGRVYLSTQEGFVTALNLADGKIAWRYQFPQTLLKGDLALSDSLLLIPGPKGLYTYDISALEARWVYRMSQEITAPVASREFVYFGSANRLLYVLRLANGSLAGTSRLGDEILAAPVLAEGLVLVGASDGKLYAFEEAPQPRQTAAPQRPGNSPPSWMQRR